MQNLVPPSEATVSTTSKQSNLKRGMSVYQPLNPHNSGDRIAFTFGTILQCLELVAIRQQMIRLARWTILLDDALPNGPSVVPKAFLYILHDLRNWDEKITKMHEGDANLCAIQCMPVNNVPEMFLDVNDPLLADSTHDELVPRDSMDQRRANVSVSRTTPFRNMLVSRRKLHFHCPTKTPFCESLWLPNAPNQILGETRTNAVWILRFLLYVSIERVLSRWW